MSKDTFIGPPSPEQIAAELTRFHLQLQKKDTETLPRFEIIPPDVISPRGEMEFPEEEPPATPQVGQSLMLNNTGLLF